MPFTSTFGRNVRAVFSRRILLGIIVTSRDSCCYIWGGYLFFFAEADKKWVEVLEYSHPNNTCGVFSTWPLSEIKRNRNDAPVLEVSLSCELRVRESRGQVVITQECKDKFHNICHSQREVVIYRRICSVNRL
ncbi:hypothetical protein V5799_020365 [Amblyomma americanum]|uniref:Uncharacterized protein n=1 Tax=Amblyomma americanum TaxID=6943 RepID=A0AAQ4EU12_AMBAM